MKYVKPALKTVFVIGLLYFLVQKGFISVQVTRRAFESWPQLLAPVGVIGFLVFMGALRWQWLLRAQGIRIQWWRALELTWVGNFFNIALPGAVSGDFVKAFYIGKEIPGKRGHAFGAILFDRLAGLSALVLVSGTAMILGGGEKLSVLTPLIVFSAFCALVFYAYLFLMREHWDPMLKTLRQLEARWPKAGSITRIYEGLRHYHHHRWTVAKVLLLSVGIHLSVGWVFIQFANILGSTGLPLLGVYTVFPLGLLVTAVPVAPAGVGTGHAAFLYFFHLIGSERGADVFTLFALSQLFYGGIGGIVYLRFRSHEEAPPVAAAARTTG